MNTLNISKLSLAVVFTLSTAPVFAQSSLLENFEGRVLSYSKFADNKLNRKMLMTFEEHSQANSIAFSIDHTCGYVLGTLNLNDHAGVLGDEINIEINKFGRTRQCSTEEFDDLRTLQTADRFQGRRQIGVKFYLSSKATGSELEFADVTQDIKKQRARQAILDSYWARGVDTAPEYYLTKEYPVDKYLQSVQQLPADFPFLVVHNFALRIFEGYNPNGIYAETYLVTAGSIGNGWPDSGELFETSQTKFSFDNTHGFTQGSIEFGPFSWSRRINVIWPDVLRSKNRFQVNGDSLTLSSDTSEDDVKFNRLFKSAKIEDLKHTEWVGNIASENVTVKFTKHSLEEIILSVKGVDSETLVKLNANDRGSFHKAEVVSDISQHALVTTLNNALPDMKSVVLDYSDANNRKLHIITQTEVFSLTEKRASIPIIFN
ncbi:hypothetical protein HC752_12895 [Vibrio sp. S9_S30]|uniref:hypothetical protein n=1 Tax=Vibrio sp. S9_S30 TaxID=2720226 RepID=UPI00168131D1|nr:hypothetical protein [Vibrio sp. S9_S30]MBD1557831.1 hypothetical protein [Vibrio sp. S9_S30]